MGLLLYAWKNFQKIYSSKVESVKENHLINKSQYSGAVQNASIPVIPNGFLAVPSVVMEQARRKGESCFLEYIYIYGIGVKSGPHGAAASATCEG